MEGSNRSHPIPVELIERRIRFIRGHKVMLDGDLAELYGVETRTINQAVKRNPQRFPEDFMFQLSNEEQDLLQAQPTVRKANLKSQSVISSWGGARVRPYAFTEQGVAMLSSVLRSERAVAVNVEIMRAFVAMRRMLATHQELAHRLNELETQMARKFETYDDAIAGIFRTLRELMNPTPSQKRPIGFFELEEKSK